MKSVGWGTLHLASLVTKYTFSTPGWNQLKYLQIVPKWPPSCSHFQMHFIGWKVFSFKWNVIELCSFGFSSQYVSICSNYGLVPNRQQAIIWSNDDPVYWCMYTCITSINELGVAIFTKVILLISILCEVEDATNESNSTSRSQDLDPYILHGSIHQITLIVNTWWWLLKSYLLI